MKVAEVKDVLWPNELLEYCEMPYEKGPRRVGFVETRKELLQRCRPTRPVGSYLELQELVSRIAALNGRYMMFLRGQSSLYFRGKDEERESDFATHSLLPTLWRGDAGERREAVELLATTTQLVRSKVRNSHRIDFESSIVSSYQDNPLAVWAIIQHYGDVLRCPTPMLDLTRSLQVACHFAHKAGKPTGYVYVLGFPWPTERFSTSVDDGIVLASLLGATPCVARRPLAQDGYLACVADYWKILADVSDAALAAMEGGFHRRILAVLEVAWGPDFWAGAPIQPYGEQFEPHDDPFRDFLASEVGWRTNRLF